MYIQAIFFICIAIIANGCYQPVQADPDTTKKQGISSQALSSKSDAVLFQNLLDEHWSQIFPDGGRNVGGPQFFKYIYDNLAKNHDLFRRYNRFYCGVSGSIVRPDMMVNYDVVKIKDTNGNCIVGQYHRCCWPCSCDIMKHARAEKATIQLPNDTTGEQQEYWLLTIGDPCTGCDQTPCDSLPPEVTAYQCKNGVTQNGLRLHEGKLTTEAKGRLVFAVLHNAMPISQSAQKVDAQLLNVCQDRFNATPEDLDNMGGMGNIFVEVSLINSDETFSNSTEDLCE